MLKKISMLEKIRKDFIKYAKTFELRDPNIMRKFHHSFRVMEYSREIALSLNLSDEDVELAMVIGLLHDISRFRQWSEYGTFDDSKSLDHGKFSVDIIKEIKSLDMFNAPEEIIYKAIYNHNKFSIEEGLSERELLFAKIIRDADKIDIIKEQGNVLKETYKDLNEKLVNQFYEKRLVENKYVKSDVDHIIRMLSFVYDFNFEYTYNLILKENIVQNKFNLLINYCENQKLVEELEQFLLTYMKGKC